MKTANAVILICDLHKKDGTEPISKLPGLWHRKLDERWQFWVNGHMEPMPLDGYDQKLAPGDCFVDFNGFPAGIFSLISGEGTIAAGSEANYHTFCVALEAALA